MTESKMHSFFSHTVVAILLFVISLFLFDGSGMYTVILGATAETAGNLMVAGDDFAGTADRLEGVLARIVALIASIVIYYFLAILILALFGMIKK